MHNSPVTVLSQYGARSSLVRIGPVHRGSTIGGFDADPTGRSRRRIHAKPARWCGWRRSARPAACASMRSRMPPHVAARAAAPRASRKDATRSTTSSPRSAGHGNPGISGSTFRGEGVGGRRFSRAVLRVPRRPRRGSWTSQPITPQNPARGAEVADADERAPAAGRLSRRLSQSQSAWPNTATTARARARVFRLEATAMPESRGKGEEDVRDGSRRGGGAGRGSRLGRGGGGGEREDPGAIEGPLADGEEVLEYAPATRPLVPGLAVGGA